MIYRVLFAVPWLSGLAFLLLDLTLRGGPAHPVFMRTEIELVKAAAMVGALAAAFTYRPGEYLRKAWLLIGGCMFLLLARDLIGMLPNFDWANWRWAMGAWTAAANLSQVVGIWLLARAWHRAGMGFPGPGWAKALLLVVTVALAGAAGGPPLVTYGERLLAGDSTAVVSIASSVGDIVSLVLIAPLLLTTLALRGGLLGWPWGLLTLSYVMWLGYDASAVLAPVLGAEGDTVKTLTELFRNLGCTFGMSAGLAQRAVVRAMQRGTQS